MVHLYSQIILKNYNKESFKCLQTTQWIFEKMEEESKEYRWETGYEKVSTDSSSRLQTLRRFTSRTPPRLQKFEKVVLIIIVPLFNHWLQTWEAIKEDSDGLLEVSVQEMIQRARRKRMIEKSGAKIKLGMMRHMFIVLDMSECMRLQVRYRVNKIASFRPAIINSFCISKKHERLFRNTIFYLFDRIWSPQG
jgi:hypothetical protein